MAADVSMGASSPSIMHIWFSFEGRLRRADYWMKYILPILVISVVLSLVDALAGLMIVLDDTTGAGIGILSSIFAIVSIWIALAAGAKRCHDRGRSGWFQLLLLLPVIGWIWLLVELCFLRGTDGENRFGPDPLAA